MGNKLVDGDADEVRVCQVEDGVEQHKDDASERSPFVTSEIGDKLLDKFYVKCTVDILVRTLQAVFVPAPALTMGDIRCFHGRCWFHRAAFLSSCACL